MLKVMEISQGDVLKAGIKSFLVVQSDDSIKYTDDIYVIPITHETKNELVHPKIEFDTVSGKHFKGYCMPEFYGMKMNKNSFINKLITLSEDKMKDIIKLLYLCVGIN